MAAVSNLKIALVTGGNKGIGFAICRALAKSNNPAIHVLLGSRDEKRGKEAVNALKKEGLDVEAVTLDVSDRQSIEKAANTIQQRHGTLDILVNNAGMAFKGDRFDEEVARTTIATNYYGIRHMIDTFLPLMKDGGRIVNVSSMSGQSALRHMSEKRQKQFLAEDLSVTQLDALMEEFIEDVKNGKWKKRDGQGRHMGCQRLEISNERN